MSDLRELYQEVILDHNRHPRNYGPLEGENHTARGHNPLCGDIVVVHLKLEEDVVMDVTFEGNGCAISKASASVMTEALKGKTRAEAEAMYERFHALVTGAPGADASELGKLAVFEGVKEFPIRVKCATLVWHTLQAALENRAEPVTTE